MLFFFSSGLFLFLFFSLNCLWQTYEQWAVHLKTSAFSISMILFFDLNTLVFGLAVIMAAPLFLCCNKFVRSCCCYTVANCTVIVLCRYYWSLADLQFVQITVHWAAQCTRSSHVECNDLYPKNETSTRYRIRLIAL